MNQRTKYLTPHETQELFKVIQEDDSRHAVRNRAIFHIGKYCALRASEIGLIHISDYDPDMKQLLCRRLKHGRDNTLRIVEHAALAASEEYLEIRGNRPDLPLFFSQEQKPVSRKMLDYLMKNYCRHTSIPQNKHHFHTLRHTRAIEILDASGSIYDTQFWLGHTNIRNTQIYLQYTTRQQEKLYSLLSKQEEIQ